MVAQINSNVAKNGERDKKLEINTATQKVLAACEDTNPYVPPSYPFTL